ncbi:glucosaminidase domain-containing protein [Aurantivibrio infirmus]
MASILPVASRLLISLVFIAYSAFCVLIIFVLAENIDQPPRELSFDNSTIFDNTELDAPDFSSFDIVEEKKTQFFNFLTPLINELNVDIRNSRSRLLDINNKLNNGVKLSRRERFFVIRLADRYSVSDSEASLKDKVQRLLRRVDELPPSMVLAQAATESAWGTSRFAVRGNNYFGEWCFKSGCGFVPKLREEDSYHEVAKFDDVRSSLHSYFFNINTHRAYRELRSIRASLREEDKLLDGRVLVEGLTRYSERREDYIVELKQIIAINELHLLDQEQSQNSSM